jgi:hypothetical protein
LGGFLAGAKWLMQPEPEPALAETARDDIKILRTLGPSELVARRVRSGFTGRQSRRSPPVARR